MASWFANPPPAMASPARNNAQESAALAALKERLREDEAALDQQLRQAGESLDDATLRRWLRAESYRVDKAEQRIRAHAVWRVKYVASGRIREAEVHNELDAQKTFLQGLDVHGRPVTIVLADRHVKAERELQETTRYICYCLDTAIAAVDPVRNPDGKLAVVFDLSGLGYSNLDYSALKSVFDLLQNHYPERLGVLWMWEAPTIFWGLWKALCPFIDAVTQAKVQFVYKADMPKLQAVIPAECLPEFLGGKAPLVPVQEAAQKLKLPGATNGQC